MEQQKVVALTFDDGPNTTTTVEVLDLLEKYKIKASFFLVGNQINKETENVVKRAYDMGCELNNHSKTHGYMDKMSKEEISAEVEFTSKQVERITGEPTMFFRPPYIAVNDTMYETISLPFICGIGADDWDQRVSVEQRIERILGQMEDGAIILLHDSIGNHKTVEALDSIIPELLSEGYEFVTVSELFHRRNVAYNSHEKEIYSILRPQKYSTKVVEDKDADEIVKIYNSNPEFLEHHMGIGNVSTEFALQDLHDMRKQGFVSELIIEKQSGEIIGFFECRVADSTYLSLLILDAKYKGHGHGKSIYNYIENELKKKNVNRIRIDVVDDYEQNVVGFWREQGFTSEERIELEWNKKIMHAQVMYKSI